jgi:hypothetical protein
MSSLFLEKDSDLIYEEFQDSDLETVEDEYREDRMDQMISKYGY